MLAPLDEGLRMWRPEGEGFAKPTGRRSEGQLAKSKLDRKRGCESPDGLEHQRTKARA